MQNPLKQFGKVLLGIFGIAFTITVLAMLRTPIPAIGIILIILGIVAFVRGSRKEDDAVMVLIFPFVAVGLYLIMGSMGLDLPRIVFGAMVPIGAVLMWYERKPRPAWKNDGFWIGLTLLLVGVVTAAMAPIIFTNFYTK